MRASGISGEKDGPIIPTKADILKLASNNILEIAAGDVITASYTDEFTQNSDGASQLLTAQLQATYFNAYITPIIYDLVRQRDGAVSEVVPATNTRTDSAHNRYLIDPLAYRDIERDADRRGLQVLGIYHSHPDVPARPSQFDLDNAFPYLSYLIVTVASGKAVESLCWRLNETPREFVAENIEIV